MRAIVIAAAAGVGWIGISYAMEPLFPMGDWRWLILAAVAFIVGGIAWQWPKRKTPPQEIRLNDTTTYREQPDGSRIVTQTTLAKPVRIEGTVGETKVGGRAEPGRSEDQS